MSVISTFSIDVLPTACGARVSLLSQVQWPIVYEMLPGMERVLRGQILSQPTQLISEQSC